MKWKGADLADKIKQKANGKKLLTQAPDGVITPELEQSILSISKGIAQVHVTWQGAARVNNCIVTGGAATPGGPIAGAIGQGPTAILSEKFKAADLESAINAAFPPKLFPELTPEHKAFNKAVAKGFEQAFNLWITTTGMSNILVQGGNSSHTTQNPGSLSNATGTVPSVMTGFTQKVDFSIFVQNAVDACGSLLKQAPDGNITPELKVYIEAISEGLKDYQNTWLLDTKMKDMQVNGGLTMVGSGSLTAPAQGRNGELS